MALKAKIEDSNAEIKASGEECKKYKSYMKFLDWLIKEFRPRLSIEGGLKALTVEQLR